MNLESLVERRCHGRAIKEIKDAKIYLENYQKLKIMQMLEKSIKCEEFIPMKINKGK